MNTFIQFAAAGALMVLLVLPETTDGAPNFFSEGSKEMPSIGRRSSLPVRPSNAMSSDIRKLLDENTLKTYEKIQASSLGGAATPTCLSRHEAGEILKLLQAATKK